MLEAIFLLIGYLLMVRNSTNKLVPKYNNITENTVARSHISG